MCSEKGILAGMFLVCFCYQDNLAAFCRLIPSPHELEIAMRWVLR